MRYFALAARVVARWGEAAGRACCGLSSLASRFSARSNRLALASKALVHANLDHPSHRRSIPALNRNHGTPSRALSSRRAIASERV